MHKMSKQIEKIINENLKFDSKTESIDRYILHCSKHLKVDVLPNKFEQLRDYLIKHYDADVELIKDEYIVCDQKCMKLRIQLKGENKTILTMVNSFE